MDGRRQKETRPACRLPAKRGGDVDVDRQQRLLDFVDHRAERPALFEHALQQRQAPCLAHLDEGLQRAAEAGDGGLLGGEAARRSDLDLFRVRFRRPARLVNGLGLTHELASLFNLIAYNLFDEMPAWNKALACPLEQRIANLANPEVRKTLQHDLDHHVERLWSGNWARLMVMESKDPSLVGKYVSQIAAERGRKTRPDIKLGICGEHGGDPASVEFCHRTGLDYVSCSPYRVPISRLAAAQDIVVGTAPQRVIAIAAFFDGKNWDEAH